jgi:hypothetical protein
MLPAHQRALQQNLPKSIQNCPKLPKFVKIFLKTISLGNFETPPKIEILMFFKKPKAYV